MSSGGMQPQSSGIGFQNSTGWNAADPRAANVYNSILDRGLALSNRKYQPYKGQLVAGFTPDQLAAFQGVRNMQGVQNPYIDAARNYTTSAVDLADPTKFGMDSLSRYMNPFQQNVIDATMANLRNQNQTQLSDLTGRAISSGAMGGDRSGVARAEYLRGANLNNNQTLANLQAQNYQQAVQQYNQQQGQAIAANQAAAAGMSGLGNQAQSSRLADLQALLGSGGQQQAQTQRGLDTAYQQWMRQQSFPYQQLQFLSGLASGIGPLLGGSSGSSGFSTSQTSQAGPNMGSQILGGLFSLGGLLASPYSGGGTLGGSMLSGLGGLFRARGGAVEDEGGVSPFGGPDMPYGDGAGYVPPMALRAARFNPPEARAPSIPEPGAGSVASRGTIGEIASRLGGMSKEDRSNFSRLVGEATGRKLPAFSQTEMPSQYDLANLPVNVPLPPRRPDDLGTAGRRVMLPDMVVGRENGGRVGFWAGGSEDDDRPALSDYIDQRAAEAGFNPKHLKAIMDYESGINPDRWGGKGGNYYGLIQFGPSEREKYGIVPGKTDAYGQTDAAIRFLKDRGYKPEMGLEDMYSTVLAGSPGHYNRADQNGSVAEHVAKMRARYGIDGVEPGMGALAYSGSDKPRPAAGTALGAIDGAVNVNPNRADGLPSSVSSGGEDAASTGPKPFISPEAAQALMAAGLGMMASRSPNFLSAVGEGGLTGLGAYQNAIAANAEKAKEARNEQMQRERFAEEKRWHDLQAAKSGASQDHIGVVGEDQFGQKIYGYTSGPKAGLPVSGAGKVPESGLASVGQGSESAGNIDWTKSGQEFLTQIPESEREKIKAIAEGRARLPTGMGANNPNARRTYAYLTAYDPSFDVGNADARIQARKQFASTKPNDAGGQIIAGNTAINHLGELSKWGEKLPQHGLPIWNAAQNRYEEFTGGATEYKRYNTAATLFAKEAEKFYRGVGGTQHEIEGLQKLLDPSMSPDQRRAAIQEQAELMRGKIEALKDQWSNVMGSTPMPEIVRGKAETALKIIDGLSELGTVPKEKTEKAPSNPVPKPQVPVPSGEREAWFAATKRAIARGADRAAALKRLRQYVPDAPEDFDR